MIAAILPKKCPTAGHSVSPKRVYLLLSGYLRVKLSVPRYLFAVIQSITPSETGCEDPQDDERQSSNFNGQFRDLITTINDPRSNLSNIYPDTIRSVAMIAQNCISGQ